MKNNNAIRAKKFKVGSLYRNDRFPENLHLCIGECDWQGDQKKHKRKGLVIVRDAGFVPGSAESCEGHIITAEAVKNWNWREV
jgi:hypothetical protein